MRSPCSGYTDGLLAKQIIHDRNVVRRQIPHDVHISLDDTKVDPHGVEVIEIADLAGRDQLAHFAHRPREDEGVIHREHDAAPLGERTKLFGMVGLGRKRLHDKHVLTRPERRPRQLEVAERRRRDNDQVEVRRAENLLRPVGHGPNPILRSDSHSPLVAEVAHRRHPTVRVAGEISHEIRAPVSAPDDTYTKCPHSDTRPRASGGPAGIEQDHRDSPEEDLEIEPE